VKSWADIEEEILQQQKKLTLLEQALLTDNADKQVKAIRERMMLCLSALGSDEPEIRGGGLKTMMAIIVESTKVRKQDLRQFYRHGIASVVGDREARKLVEEGKETSQKQAKSSDKAKNPAKVELAKAISALQKLHPPDQRGPDSAYAKAVKELRTKYANTRKSDATKATAASAATSANADKAKTDGAGKPN
jgi:hypothetical protein